MAMTKIANIQMRIDVELKKDFETLCGKLGLTCSQAITMLADSCGTKDELPFNIEYNMNWKKSEAVQQERIAIRIEEDKKKRFSEFCDARGLNMSAVVKMFMIQCLEQGKLPL